MKAKTDRCVFQRTVNTGLNWCSSTLECSELRNFFNIFWII